MIKREFKARIVGDFMRQWLLCAQRDENITEEFTLLAYGGDDLNRLHGRISGKVATLTENEYPEGENDFFEKEDNNFVIYRELFDEEYKK